VQGRAVVRNVKTATRSGTALWAAAGAALLANVSDAGTTWIGVTQFHGREVGVLAWLVVRTWGLAPALVLLKGGGTLLILGIAAVGSEGETRWWRARANQRWVVFVALGIATAWFGYLTLRNVTGMWIVQQLTKQ
jgi:hypothetical protein